MTTGRINQVTTLGRSFLIIRGSPLRSSERRDDPPSILSNKSGRSRSSSPSPTQAATLSDRYQCAGPRGQSQTTGHGTKCSATRLGRETLTRKPPTIACVALYTFARSRTPTSRSIDNSPRLFGFTIARIVERILKTRECAAPALAVFDPKLICHRAGRLCCARTRVGNADVIQIATRTPFAFRDQDAAPPGAECV